jgi:hypothetical protein
MGNGLIRVRAPASRMCWTIPNDKRKKIGDLIAARVVPPDFHKGTGTTWIFPPYSTPQTSHTVPGTERTYSRVNR